MIAACYCVYDDFEFLYHSVISIKDYVDKVFFFCSFSRYDGTSENDDNEITLNIIEMFKKQDENKFVLIRKDWKNQIQQRNDSISIIQHEGYEYCLIIDADEIYDRKDIENLLEIIKNNPQIDVFQSNFHTYFKSLKYKIYPIQKLDATVVVKTHVRLNKTRGANNPEYTTKLIEQEKVCWHHPSHVRTDERMIKKYKIAIHEYGISWKWIDQIWFNWTPSTKNFHPSNPSSFQSVLSTSKFDFPEFMHDLYENEENFISGIHWYQQGFGKRPFYYGNISTIVRYSNNKAKIIFDDQDNNKHILSIDTTDPKTLEIQKGDKILIDFFKTYWIKDKRYLLNTNI